MLQNLGVIEACFTCGRSRARAARKLGGKPLLEWIVRRATECQRLDGVIVLTQQAPENAFLARLTPSDVPVFVGEADDPLSCLVAALERYPAQSVVRIRSDCPFVDVALIDRLIAVAEAEPEHDYVGYRLRDGRPAVLSPVGVCAEWFRTQALRRIAKRAVSPLHRQDVTRYMHAHPEKYSVRLLPAPEKIDREDVRLTVDMEEDWENTLAIFEALGSQEMDWQRIADLLDHQPALRKRMAMLNRAQMRS